MEAARLSYCSVSSLAETWHWMLALPLEVGHSAPNVSSVLVHVPVCPTQPASTQSKANRTFRSMLTASALALRNISFSSRLSKQFPSVLVAGFLAEELT